MKTEIVCFTSDKGTPYLPGFLHQWNKYFGASVRIVGFTKPEFELPNAEFVSMGAFKDYPAARWSNAVIEYLDRYCEADILLIVLEDYWLIRPVNIPVIMAAAQYMRENKNVLRCDLTTDRVYSNSILRDIQPSWSVPMDLVECNPGGSYAMSLQAALWNKSHLRWLLRKEESPWDFEIVGTRRVAESELRVIGTRQNPVNYLIACNKGKFDPSGAWMYPPRTLSDSDWAELQREVSLPY